MNIIELARKACNGKVRDPLEVHMFYRDELERFAALVREECAKRCDQMHPAALPSLCAAAIREMKDE